jgi:hypothetical protein
MVWEDRYNSLKLEMDDWKGELQKNVKKIFTWWAGSKKPKPNT